jgi:hypothetical protein
MKAFSHNRGRLELPCAYCDSPAKSHRDHVPPESVFPLENEWKKDLITAPACRHCNERHQLDDDYFAIFLGSLESVARSPAAKSFLKETDRRVASASEGMKRRLARESQPNVQLVTPAGVYAGTRTIWKADLPRLLRIARTTVTGLHYHHFQRRIPYTHVVMGVVFPDQLVRTQAEKQRIDAIFRDFANDPPLETGGGVFKYRFHTKSNDPQSSEWLMTLYDAFAFGGSVLRRDTELGKLALTEEQRMSKARKKRPIKKAEQDMTKSESGQTPEASPVLEDIIGRVFEDQEVHVDGLRFIGCTFKRCIFVYSGGALPNLDSCVSDSCDWSLRGAASRTIELLRGLYISGGLEGIVQGYLDYIVGLRQ